MKLHNQATVAAGADVVFALLNDPERIVGCLPGATVTGHDGDVWNGGVTVKVGPITVAYTGTVRFDEVHLSERRLHLVARGTDSRGSGDAEADVTLVVQEASGGGCVLDIDTDLLIRGKIAQFGRGAIATVSDKILAQFARNLGELAAGGVTVPRTDAPRPALDPALDPVLPPPTSVPAGELDGWGLLVAPVLKAHGRQVALLGAALLQGYLWGRAVTIERHYRRPR